MGNKEKPLMGEKRDVMQVSLIDLQVSLTVNILKYLPSAFFHFQLF